MVCVSMSQVAMSSRKDTHTHRLLSLMKPRGQAITMIVTNRDFSAKIVPLVFKCSVRLSGGENVLYLRSVHPMPVNCDAIIAFTHIIWFSSAYQIVGIVKMS